MKSTFLTLSFFLLFGKINFAKDLTATPVYFLENQGQILNQYHQSRSDLDFKLNATNGLQVFIRSGKLEYQWLHSNPKTENDSFDVFSYRMDVVLLHANPNAIIKKEKPKRYFERYFQPWINTQNKDEGIKAQAFQKIIYKDIYPNIDWTLYINKQNQLEYDFIVHPGGNPADIQIQYSGAIELYIEESGNLHAQSPMGEIVGQKPFVYFNRKVYHYFIPKVYHF